MVKGIAAAFIAASLAACSPAGIPAGSTRPSTRPTARPTPPQVLGAPIGEISKAWPTVRPLSIDLWHLPGGLGFVPIVATRDGKYLVGSTIRPSTQEDARVAFVLLDPISQTVTEIKRFPNPVFQATYADADERWVVWVEASQQPNFDDWSMYAYDRTNGSVKTLTRAALAPNGQPISGPMVVPRIDHGIVVWSAGTKDAPLGTHADTYSADLRTGAIRTIAQDAIGPSISWPFLVYSQRAAASDPNLQLMTLDLQAGRRWEVTGVISATYYAVNGDSLVWIDQHNAALRLRTLTGSQDEVLVDFSPLGQGGGFVQFPSISERVVAWSQKGGAWAYDRKLKVRLQLAAEEPLGYATVNGVGLDWYYKNDPSSSEKINSNLKYVLLSQLF